MMPFYLHHDPSGNQHAGTKKGCLFAREDEGGLPSESSPPKLVGTELQVKWPGPIEVHTNAHFYGRNAYESVARKQDAASQMNSRAILSMLEGKPAGVVRGRRRLSHHDLEKLRDQARRMIM